MFVVICIDVGLNPIATLRRSTRPPLRSADLRPRREKPNRPFELSFSASSKVDSWGSRVTSDGGLILVREIVAQGLDYEPCNART